LWWFCFSFHSIYLYQSRTETILERKANDMRFSVVCLRNLNIIVLGVIGVGSWTVPSVSAFSRKGVTTPVRWTGSSPSTTTTPIRTPSTSSSSSSSTSTTRLFLADEIKEYRKGLSQIHKNPEDVGPNRSPNKRVDCVFKFGGSSLANADRIDHVARLIKDQIDLGYRPRAVVCSAMGKTTNNLLSAGEFALG
jgi:hypothetical protein